MIRFLPLLLIFLTGLAMWMFSARQMRRKLNAASYLLDDPQLAAHFTPLARALDLPKIPVLIYDIAPINGLADADGRVFITRGFLEKYRQSIVTGDEIASVVAHELGHVALGHSKRRMMDFTGQNILRLLLTTVLGRFIPFIGPWLANMATSALAARLSQRDEFEADEFASALLIKAGMGTEPQISLFRKLDQLSQSGAATSPPAWLMTHPKTTDRITAIERNTLKWHAPRNL
ncbi:peptidase M48 [Thioclava sp. SK-1]|uniref:M48 family metallopeptidase n=1 Tax=Thioclava sp. SK-1 TaxID=1889770 RepID=UPI000826ADD9|nr:M48 family metallopeptidase [Thioclava sp. SK-1]OCX66144.1 peptidase M48 [Thioclava sp. SK-1]